MLAACDRCCDGLLGTEYRTAYRRLLARAMPGLDGMLRSTTKPEAIAAALCWESATATSALAKGRASCGSRT